MTLSGETASIEPTAETVDPEPGVVVVEPVVLTRFERAYPPVECETASQFTDAESGFPPVRIIENKENTRAFRRGMNPTTHSSVHY
ncbi:hypothetical protein [Halorubrum yunnanense]|uniref:Uncharacterized protein n=1 Tax=Halorubrum yunnanense TaxID=1526162 RepID=A0ABD5YCE1_9EURY|nr:hypothetical protein [Halorubrum yunnanense]